MRDNHLLHLRFFLLQHIYLRRKVKSSSSQKEKSKDLNVYGSWTDHVSTRLPHPPNPNTAIYIFFQFLVVMVTQWSNITAWPEELQLFNTPNWSVLNRLQWTKTEEGKLSLNSYNKVIIIWIFYMCVYVCVSCMVHARQIPWEHEYKYYSVPVSVLLSRLPYTCASHRFSPGWYCGSVAVK